MLAMTGLVAVSTLSGCDKADDERIPSSAVYLPFTTGLWNVYGVAGAGSWGYYSKSQGEPQGFPYAAMHETGFGGILLVTDYLGSPVAYSAACPVERSNRFHLDVTDVEGKSVAMCPECGSTYDVFANQGTPLSGPAHEKKYALTRYKVTANELYPVIVTD
ncbi:MAG: hypothetical protein NC187_05480 [Candidatus Amulumruptor caecigallinarius]|nr:hypothetical protein [Candidatus Amulumruptor caecigallinarius]MCM1396920.1 hypothetical protein [Candidatus Amulumruptor caecigallinarius]MCM1454136.1 hypothetical protein [bacterium]